MKKTNNQYYLSYDSKSLTYKIWQVDLDSPSLFKSISSRKGNTFLKGDQFTQIGNYILQWSALSKDGNYDYRLLEFNPDETSVLGSYDSNGNWTDAALESGTWSKSKFFGSRADFSNPSGAKKGYESGSQLILVSMHNFVLNWIPTAGRGTYQLFNFDHKSTDPLPAPITPQGAWLTIQKGHELFFCNGFVIDWNPSTSDYAIYQFDPQNANPLSYPSAQEGNWKSLGINSKHRLSAIGDYVLDWDTSNNSYRLWEFDYANSGALSGPVKEGKLPASLTKGTSLSPIETIIPNTAKAKNKPGSMGFMRDQIEHVVYYMIENRSFDHVCGWLYKKKDEINAIGQEGPYRGVDKNFTNTYQGKEYAITKYNRGKLSDKKGFTLDLDENDPYHDNSDVLRQMFSKNINDYYAKKEPDMGGFAWNNGTDEVMLGYSPEQLPILNGLGKNFAISDDWFCSMPGGTDVNRAFSLTGSSLGHLNNFQNGDEYTEWANYPHRPSIWKVLWSNGIEDFKLYNAVEWFDCKFTYNLFLDGQIPYIDDPFKLGDYAPQLNQFYDDLKYGTLPKFSYLEPKWVASNGSTSYHPGNDLIPGERTLNDIFNAIQNSEYWDKTLFVITFDEHGGLPDHVKPPYAINPYLNDSLEGFDFDIMGVRIPTILVSPWIKENSVFRSETDISYDSTSILATLLDWCGVPRSKWGLGERTNNAPTFESVLQEKIVRTDKVTLTPPYDSNFPKQTDGSEAPVNGSSLPIHDLHRLVVPRMIKEMTPNLSRKERSEITQNILGKAQNQKELHKMLDDLHNKHNR